MCSAGQDSLLETEGRTELVQARGHDQLPQGGDGLQGQVEQQVEK